MVRLNKYLAECGICSRRDADKIILQGRVSINGQIAVNGMQVEAYDRVEVDGKPVQAVMQKVVLAYNKPVGIVCTERDRHADKTIVAALNYPVRVTYAGRLDKDSSGLILLTNDGDLIQKMMKSSNQHEKEYVVQVDKPITQAFLSGMAKGVYLQELEKTTRPCKVVRTEKDTFRIILTQGLNRQIRRMCEYFGYHVKVLTRIRVINIQLGTLESGSYREITGEELETLYKTIQQ